MSSATANNANDSASMVANEEDAIIDDEEQVSGDPFVSHDMLVLM